MQDTLPSKPETLYYLLGNTIPVRVTLTADGLPLGAERPDPLERRLVLDARLLSRLEQSWEVEEIDRETFERLCARALGHVH